MNKHFFKGLILYLIIVLAILFVTFLLTGCGSSQEQEIIEEVEVINPIEAELYDVSNPNVSCEIHKALEVYTPNYIKSVDHDMVLDGEPHQVNFDYDVEETKVEMYEVCLDDVSDFEWTATITDYSGFTYQYVYQ